MADATHAQMMRRARRFAGFYLGDDPAVPNYDRFDQVVMRSDVPVNLGIVPLMASAFLYTGEGVYREWIEEYVGAWMERIEENGGILPDNIGPNGKIGENRQGQWWGGFYGWAAKSGHNMMTSALTVAAEAALVTHLGDERVDLTLVNLSPVHTRAVGVGAGSFGEHTFTGVRADDGEAVAVDGGYFEVRLAPGSQIVLSAGMRRYCRTSSYAFPWHQEGIPFR